MPRPRIAVFSGATATVQSSPPLITSDKARKKYGLPLVANPASSLAGFDALRPQRLAAKVTVYVEAFSAHPLERDRAELYAAPDGYVDPSGAFHLERTGPNDVPVHEVTLEPEDGLYLLPYMSRQSTGSAWDYDGTSELVPFELCRQPFYPDASRIFEEINRFGIGESGQNNLLSARADFDFYRPAPSGGYTKGLPAEERTDAGEGDVLPEVLGEDFFPYRPVHLRREPSRLVLARLTNDVHRALARANYDGAIWLEGSPFVEETSYWLNLLVDTRLPFVGTASQRPHGTVGNDGDRNIIDSVDYILSRIWADPSGHDCIGVVVIQDEQVFTAREVQKGDARPGGYVATGGHGGIVGSIGDPGPPALTFRPVRRHTHTSELNISHLPETADGTALADGIIRRVTVPIKDGHGQLLGAAIPNVTIVKHARYSPAHPSDEARANIELMGRVERNLHEAPLSGFVFEGGVPYGIVEASVDKAIRLAAFSGIPSVKVGRGNAEGITPVYPSGQPPHCIAGSNLTATKARLLLMASLLRFGALPSARDPSKPNEQERSALAVKLARYQRVFDTH